MKQIILAALLSLTFLTNLGEAQPPQVSGYQINWFDEFDGNSLDTSKWTPIFSTSPTNNSLHAYLPSNVVVSGGNLVILSTDNPFGQFAYQSGQVISTATQRYGRFEVRGKLPTSTGMWPAIWLLPDSPPHWPSQGEIDIMENRGNQPNLTSSAFHWGTNPPFFHDFVYNEFEMQKNGSPVNFHDSFHTYATEWDPEQIRFYVDGVHYHTVRNSGVDNFLTNGQTNPMRLIINTAVGGNFLQNPNATTQWPQFFDVDYAYVYDRVGDPELMVENGDFEINNGSLSNWTVFGSNGANVSSSNQHAQSGSSALKLFGQFSNGSNFSGIEQGMTVAAGDTLRLTASSFVDSGDSISGSGNSAVLKIDYYNDIYGAFGSSEYISSQEIVLADAATPNNQWIERELTSTVPDGAVEARAAVVFHQVGFAGGAVFVDDVALVNLSAPQTLAANNVSVTNGNETGSLSDMASSDDVDYSILAGKAANVGQAAVQLTVDTNLSTASPTSIQFALEGSSNTPNVETKIEVFNFDSGQFEELEAAAAGLSDSVVEANLNGNLQAYVNDSDNQVVYRLSYSPTGPTLFFPWRIDIDQVSWAVKQ